MRVPTFKESIYKVQILTFFRIMNSLHRTHVNSDFLKSNLPIKRHNPWELISPQITKKLLKLGTHTKTKL
ncbi:hypothetical protein B0192_04165 [Leptospira interrogans serovar Australis]|nr:hypothetical protein B0192_04165 [Leptospira interrogans serovar Australis]